MWLRLDDDFPDHPKIAGLSDAAFRAHVTAMCYAARFGTDGHLDPAPVRRLAPARVVRELTAAGLWHANGAGHDIHDWAEYQPPAAATERARQLAAERQRRRRRQTGRDDG